MTDSSGSGRTAFGLATLAVAGAAAFTVWALTASAYSSGETLFEANDELTARLALAAPLVVTSVVWLLLHVACRFDLRAPRTVAQVIGWLLIAFAMISGFSIGLFVMPGALALVVAALMTPVAERT